MTDLRRNGRRRYKRPGHVLEHRLQIKFLLVMGANGGSRLLSRDSQHWHVVKPAAEKPSKKFRPPGTGFPQAPPQFPRHLAVGGPLKAPLPFFPALPEPKLSPRPIKPT